jgi:hypothetical protein
VYVQGAGVKGTPGFDGNSGAKDAPLATAQKAVEIIRERYKKFSKTWPRVNGVPAPAVIYMSGKFTLAPGQSAGNGMLEISGKDLPPIVIQNKNREESVVIDANLQNRVLYIDNGNKVTLDGNLRLVDGQKDAGAGIYVNDGELTLAGSVTLAHNAANRGAGIYVQKGKLFVLESAVIQDNNALDTGGGIQVGPLATVELRGLSRVTENAANKGGGVYVMTGGILRQKESAAIVVNKLNKGGFEGANVVVEKGGLFEHNDTP